MVQRASGLHAGVDGRGSRADQMRTFQKQAVREVSGFPA